MDKHTKKIVRAPHDRVRVLAVKQTAEAHKVSDTYVRQILKGGMIGGQSEQIKKTYSTLYNNISSVIS